MPYIDHASRDELDPLLEPVLDKIHEYTVGGLNYCITRLVDHWLAVSFGYTEINAAIGVLECAKSELYRRLAVPYEDNKRLLNGDVYGTRPIPKKED